MLCFDPEGMTPYYTLPGDPTAPTYALSGRSEYAADRTEFYQWLEEDDHRKPESLESNLSPRPVSPAPEKSEFKTATAFHTERARWYRDHGDGSELSADLPADLQNLYFDRLRDKIFGLRRGRANPSGTPRRPQPRQVTD